MVVVGLLLALGVILYFISDYFSVDRSSPEKVVKQYYQSRNDRDWNTVLSLLRTKDRPIYTGSRFNELGGFIFDDLVDKYGLRIVKQKLGKNLKKTREEIKETENTDRDKSTEEIVRRAWEKRKKIYEDYFSENQTEFLQELWAAIKQEKFPNEEFPSLKNISVKTTMKNDTRARTEVQLNYGEMYAMNSTTKVYLQKRKDGWYIDWEKTQWERFKHRAKQMPSEEREGD